MLSQPPVLAGQITRMIADPKSRALVDDFGGQWLHLRNVADWAPDPERYRGFDESLRYAFQQETELFLEHLIREDRSTLVPQDRTAFTLSGTHDGLDHSHQGDD